MSPSCQLGRFAFAFGSGSEPEWEEQRAKNVTERLVVLEALVESLEPIGQSISISINRPAMRTDSVFIVHGHDKATKEECARFVEKLGLNAIILHEKPTSGRTIIEKILAHADVGHAIAILTPDDFGGAFGQEPKMRARQNVILELGFFMGRLGRERTCALYDKTVGCLLTIMGLDLLK